MPYTLIRFDEVQLPTAMPVEDFGTGPVESTLRASVGGVTDILGSAQRRPRRHTFGHKGKYVGEVAYRITSDGDYRVTSDGDLRVTAASKIADLHGKTDDLKAKIGVLGTLWRERLADGELTWKRCRLMEVRHVETVANADVVSEVESVFETNQAGWRSENAVTASVSASDGVPVALVVENAGALPVEDAILRVERTSGTISEVRVVAIGIDITWTGSIAAAQTLVIDDQDQTVLIGTSDQYSGFTRNAGHTADNWLPLARGTNVLTVTVIGGDATVSLEHYNQWP